MKWFKRKQVEKDVEIEEAELEVARYKTYLRIVKQRLREARHDAVLNSKLKFIESSIENIKRTKK